MRQNYLDFLQTSHIPRTDHQSRYFHAIFSSQAFNERGVDVSDPFSTPGTETGDAWKELISTEQEYLRQLEFVHRYYFDYFRSLTFFQFILPSSSIMRCFKHSE